MKLAFAGGTPYAIGAMRTGRFHVRCVRYGKLAASYERRDDEEIRRCSIHVFEKPSQPLSTVTIPLKRIEAGIPPRQPST